MMPWTGWSSAAEAEPTALDSTGPFPIVIPPETPPREQSRLVIFSIVGVLIVGLMVAAFSLRDFGKNDVLPTGSITPLPGATAATQPAATPTTEPPATTPAQTPTPGSDVPVRIAAIRAIDPQGDGDEDSAGSPKAVDNDPATSWHSDSYQSVSFGGLKKGVGLAIKLKRKAALSAVTVEVAGSGGTVEIRTADTPDEGGSRLIGRGSFANGTVSIKAKDATPSRYVIVWFTELPSVNGKYRLEVSEVRLT
jgi:hypothetical protein